MDQLDEGVERFGTLEKLFVAALSSLAGFIDAVGFVQSKGFFVSFMSGNSTRLGVGLASSYGNALAAAGLLVAFILGVTLGTLIGQRSKLHRISVVMTTVAACLALAAWLGMQHFHLASLAMTALAMGAENAVLERNGRNQFGLTYMTGSVVKLGRALADFVTGSHPSDWRTSTVLLVSFVMGAMMGAGATSALGIAALWVGCLLAASLALFGTIHAKDDRS